MGFVWFTLKIYESKPQSQVAPSWTHPLSQLERWQILRPTSCEDKESFNQSLHSDSTMGQVLFLDIQPQREKWLIFCSTASSAELFQRWQKGIDLTEVLNDLFLKNRSVIFNVHASQKAEAEDLIEVLKDYEKSTQIGIISPSRIPLEEIRKQRPQWYFGSDRATWTKVLTFDSFALGGLVNAWSDFYILTEGDQKNLGPDHYLFESLLQQGKVLIKEGKKESKTTSPYRGVLLVD